MIKLLVYKICLKATKFAATNIIILFSVSISAQTIQGKITNTENAPVIFANVLIKDINNKNNISEYTIAKTGTYKLTLKKAYMGILIEVKATGYQSVKHEISTLQDKIYTIDFTLLKDTNKIKEVVVVGERIPFVVKEDTVTYNIQAYLDGSERKAEDVIKKLPGIDVNEKTGEIKYKNKSVETVLLEGDNLFGYNYTLGTKNINIEMIEQIQAIENYSENSLLKGLENGNKVVLNLKLKKGKMDFSGNLGLGSGLFNDLEPSFLSDNNILGITKNYKSFTTLSFNNIGENYTPFDYFGFKMNMEQLKEKDYFANKTIPESNFADNLNNRTNINNQYFGNHNFIFKIGKRMKIKSNLFYLNDRISSIETIKNLYFTEKDTFVTTDKKETQKRPIQYRGDINIKLNTSKTSLLEYDARIKQENIETPYSAISNNENNFASTLNTNDDLIKQSLLFTKKISAKKAMQFLLLHTKNTIQQSLLITPSIYAPDSYKHDMQKSDIIKNHIETKASLLGKRRNKYNITIGGIINKSNIQTGLFGYNQNSSYLVNNSTNSLTYTTFDFYQTASYHIDVKAWKFSPAYLISYFSQEKNNLITDSFNRNNKFIIKPSFGIKYQLNESSFLQWRISYDKYTNTEQYLFQTPVLIDYRTKISNTTSLDFSTSFINGFIYYYDNLYKQLHINIGVNYQENRGSYFTNVFINQNTTHVNYFYLPQNNDNLSMNFAISKYLPFLSSKLGFSSAYSFLQYSNIINNSELRNNTSQNLNTQFTINTALNGFINFSNEFGYNATQTKSKNNDTYIINSMNNFFDIRLNISKNCFALLSTNYFLPNIKKSNNYYLFVDATINLLAKNKKFEYSLLANNLLNNNNFEQIQATDYYVNIYKTNILQRHFLINISYNF